MKFNLEQAPFEVNLADILDEEHVKDIGKELLEQIDVDISSREEWMETNREWIKLATQVREDKPFPWVGASNIKYPLLTVAAMQFQSRALPSLINSNQPVRARVIGKDPDGTKRARANRVSKYLSYQIMEGMEDWMDSMDRLLFLLPITGIVYKKTYWSTNDNAVKSRVVLPNDLIVNYHAQSYDRARMTEVIPMDLNEIIELQNAEVFSDVDLSQGETPSLNRNAMDDINNLNKVDGSDMDTRNLYESHCYLDLDEDGYKEPYVVTMSEQGDVLRIVARYDTDSIKYAKSGKVLRIHPDALYTAYTFLPDPSSAVSGLGLGTLLGPLNETVNTLINQLTDAGTLSILQSGFLGRGVRLDGGAMKFRPGEWKMVNATGDDIRKSVFPMPVREPSNVLFQLLGLIIESGEKVSAVSDMMVGDNPGQNQPATTTMAVLEQGLKVFTSVNKRTHRGLAREYKQLYKVTGEYLDFDHYSDILDEQDLSRTQAEEDFTAMPITIAPASDPAIVSEAQKGMKVQSLIEKMGMGMPLNMQVVTRMALEAEGHENIKELMDVPAPQPDPAVVLEAQQFEHQKQMDETDKQLDAVKVQTDAQKTQSETKLNQAKAQELISSLSLDMRAQQQSEAEAKAEMVFRKIEIQQSAKESAQKNAQSNQQKPVQP